MCFKPSIRTLFEQQSGHFMGNDRWKNYKTNRAVLEENSSIINLYQWNQQLRTSVIKHQLWSMEFFRVVLGPGDVHWKGNSLGDKWTLLLTLY